MHNIEKLNLSNMKYIYTLFALLAIFALNAQVTFTVHAPDATTVRMHSDFFGWDTNHPDNPATSDGFGSWSLTANPTGQINYLWFIDGVAEDIHDDDCTANNVNNYGAGTNRLWNVGDGDITNDVAGNCSTYPNTVNGFDNANSVLHWTAVADAAGADATEANLSRNATAGNPGGAMEIIGFSPGGGKAYIFEYLVSDFKYNGAVKVVMNYDIKIVSADYLGTGIHVFLHTTNGSGGLTQNNFFDQQAATAQDTYVAKSHQVDGLTPAGTADQLKMVFQLACGADAGAGARIYIDNLQLVGYDASDNVTFRIDDVDDFKLNLYPNPVKNTATISATETIEMVRIYDLTGRMVKQANPNKSEFSLDVADLSKGAYLVKLNAGNKEATTKFIK